MRKKSREMSAAWALEVMDKAPYITVSMTTADGMPYAVPLSLARKDEQTFYFHCAPEGKKLDILRSNPHVCLSAVSKCKPTVGPKDGSFTLEFQSAIAFGRAELVLALRKSAEHVVNLQEKMIVSLPPVSSAKMQKLDREKTVINLYVAGHPIDEVWRASGFRSRSSVFRILNKHGIKLNRGNHSGPIKRKGISDNPQDKE